MDIQTSIPGLDLWIGNTTAQTVLDSEIPLPEGRIAVSVLSVLRSCMSRRRPAWRTVCTLPDG